MKLPSGVTVFVRPGRGEGRLLDWASARRLCEGAGPWTGLCSLDEASAALAASDTLLSDSAWTR